MRFVIFQDTTGQWRFRLVALARREALWRGVLGVGCVALVAEWICGRSPDDEG